MKIINNSNIIYDYQEIPNPHEDNQIKYCAVQVNYHLESIPDKVMEQINEITSELEDKQSNNKIYTIEDIINNTESESDQESIKLITSIMEKDEKEHAGIDKATVNLVQQLQTDCEKEIKSEQKKNL